jgi:hypothetical protein
MKSIVPSGAHFPSGGHWSFPLPKLGCFVPGVIVGARSLTGQFTRTQSRCGGFSFEAGLLGGPSQLKSGSGDCRRWAALKEGSGFSIPNEGVLNPSVPLRRPSSQS